MSSERPHVAVVGGGIAGLSLAVALSRTGVPCEVFEQSREIREVGAGVQITPNATRLLHRFGLTAELRVRAVRPEALEFRRWDDNSVLARSILGEECERLFGAPYYAIHRADLHRILAEALPTGLLHLGRRAVGFDETAAGVDLHFADGSTTRADVVVGADGIHSVIRSSIVFDRPRFSGQSVYRGLVPSGRVTSLCTEAKVILWLGPDRHFVCYPVSGGTMVNFVATVPAAVENLVESWSAQGRVEDVAAAYAGWNEDLTAVITAADSVSRWALHDRDPIEQWSSDRLTLVGDSAHPALPFLGQGANQAIEDAAVLAGCLRDARPGTIPAALNRYETIRKPRTTAVQQKSRANSKIFHLADGDQQHERDTTIKTLDPAGQSWLYGYDADDALAANALI